MMLKDILTGSIRVKQQQQLNSLCGPHTFPNTVLVSLALQFAVSQVKQLKNREVGTSLHLVLHLMIMTA